jgi:lipopolysaccharide biosynthesis regulator YciM
LDGQTLLFTALSIAVITLTAVLVVATWRLRKTIELIERRVDDAIRQFEATAEQHRKTSGMVQDILQNAQRSAANVAYVTEGVREFRRTLDAATKVLEYAVIPVLGTVSSGLAGAKAAVTHIVNRFVRKES